MASIRLALLMTLLALLPVRADEHPGWDRDALLARLAVLLNQPGLELTPVPQLPEHMFLIDPTEEQSCFVAAGESTVAFQAGDFATGLLIGDDERVHTVWFYFPVLSVSEPEPALAFYAGLFDYLLPGWAGGADWAEVSLGKAWEASARAYQNPMISFDEMIAREAVAGTKLATWGVPPDIVTYRITARAECEQVSDYLLAKPRQAERDPSKRNPAQDAAGLQLYYTNPQPVDVSATPVYLGEVSGFRPYAATEKAIRFSAPGPLAGEAIELSDWLGGQVSTPDLPDTAAAIAEGWGYEHSFMFLITDPLTEVAPGHVLLIDKAAGTVERGEPGEYDVVWSDVSGLLFGTAMVPAVDDRTGEPPYQMVNAGDLVFDTEGSAVPVDVADTPLHLGLVRQYLGARAVELPPPYTGTIEGLDLTITDGSGATATLDLEAWASIQTGEPFAPDRTHPISQPALPFTLGGRKHLLTLTTAWYEAPAGTPTAVGAILGQLFAAP